MRVNAPVALEGDAAHFAQLQRIATLGYASFRFRQAIEISRDLLPVQFEGIVLIGFDLNVTGRVSDVAFSRLKMPPYVGSSGSREAAFLSRE
jgi:hypothetical protein